MGRSFSLCLSGEKDTATQPWELWLSVLVCLVIKAVLMAGKSVWRQDWTHTAVLLLALPCLIIKTTSETRFLMLGTDLKYLCFSFFLAIFSSSESLPKSSLVNWEPRGGRRIRILIQEGEGLTTGWNWQRFMLDCSFVCPS